MKHYIGLAALCAALACGDAPTAPTPAGRMNIDPLPPWLPAVFDSVAQCVGSSPSVPLAAMHFYAVPNEALVQMHLAVEAGDVIFAAAVSETNTIYFDVDYVRFPRVWMHELAHLMYRERGHPSAIFDRCDLWREGGPDPTYTPVLIR